MRPRGSFRRKLELERRGGPGAPWRLIAGHVVYTGDTAGTVLEELAGVLDFEEAEAITEELRREGGGLHVVADEDLDELERMSNPENTHQQEDPDAS